jgi:hypothetical protein
MAQTSIRYVKVTLASPLETDKNAMYAGPFRNPGWHGVEGVTLPHTTWADPDAALATELKRRMVLQRARAE